MRTREINEGQWTYLINWGRCTVTHDNGTVIEACDIVEARRRTYEYDRSNTQQTVRYSIASGPTSAHFLSFAGGGKH